MDGGMKEDLAVIFGQLEDPRIDRHKKYPLCEIIFSLQNDGQNQPVK